MDVIVKSRQAGKTHDIVQAAARDFAYVVCPTKADALRIWQYAHDQGLDIPMPITWDEFIGRRFYGRSVNAFVIDDLDRCIQNMTHVEVKAVSLNGPEGGLA